MSENSYTALPYLYDSLNGDIDYKEWADFIEKNLKHYSQIPVNRILDLACGTGKMTRELQKKGYDLIGVDNSIDMLSVAQSYGTDVLYLHQDMRSLDLYGDVDAVVCCLDSLNYLLTTNDLNACLARISLFLNKGGLFLFDLNTPYKFQNIYGNESYVLEGQLPNSRQTLCAWQNDYNEKTKKCRFLLDLFCEQKDGSYERKTEWQTERCYSLLTIKKLLRQNGFDCLSVVSDFNGNGINDQTERWYITAKKE